MNKFLIEFYYFTDLRTDVIVEAENEIDALQLALDKYKQLGHFETWCTGKGFSIKISFSE